MTPYVRINVDCGRDDNISAGREPCQLGWYEWCGKKYCVGKKILDVGAGMCNGLKILRDIGSREVWGQDIDSRLKVLDDNLLITSIDKIPNKSYEIITCFDVIEHVMDDIVFFNHLMRISTQMVIITTPNFTRSAARNYHHCREYTIPQFTNIFSPDELWSASPDGKIHHTLLLQKKDGNGSNEKKITYLNKTNDDCCYFPIQPDMSFTHSTVDGQEWPHICGIFNLKSHSS